MICINYAGKYGISLDEAHFKTLLNEHLMPPISPVRMMMMMVVVVMMIMILLLMMMMVVMMTIVHSVAAIVYTVDGVNFFSRQEGQECSQIKMGGFYL